MKADVDRKVSDLREVFPYSISPFLKTQSYNVLFEKSVTSFVHNCTWANILHKI